jgi:hypothetical protein
MKKKIVNTEGKERREREREGDGLVRQLKHGKVIHVNA